MVCSGVLEFDYSYGYILDYIFICCFCSSCCEYGLCWSCKDLYVRFGFKKVCIGCVSVLGIIIVMGCEVFVVNSGDGVFGCVLRYSGWCCCWCFL